METAIPPDVPPDGSPLETAPVQAGRPIATGPGSPRDLAVEAGLLLVSAAVAALIVVALALRLPATNLSHTDIVGYPIFADLSSTRYPDIWYLVVVVWPLLSLALFLLGRWRLGPALRLSRARWALHAGRARPAAAPREDAIDPNSPTERFSLATRVIAVGLVWGFTGAIVWDGSGLGFWLYLVLIAAGYTAVLSLLATLLGGGGMTNFYAPGARRWVSFLNAVGAALTVAGLLAVSASTVLTTLSDHVRHPMGWLPLPVGLLLVAASVGIVGGALRWARDAGPDRARMVERRALFLVAVPVSIFLATAVLPGTLEYMDTFEYGQQMATLHLLVAGEVAYRDFLPFHGLFADTLLPAFGYQLLTPSFWGYLAGISLIVIPLTYIGVYLLAYRVVGASWAALVFVVLILFNTALMPKEQRLLFWPLILLLLAIAFDRRARVVAFVTGAAVVVFALLVPEATYAVPACGIALLTRDAYHAGWARVRPARDFALTLWAAAGGLLVTAALFAVLAAQHGVGGFIDYYLTLIPGHGLEGALPLSRTPFTDSFLAWLVAPGAFTLLAVGILVSRVRLGLLLRTSDFLMVAAASFTVLYYGSEFMGRPDPTHGALAYAGAVPLLLLSGWEVGRWLNGVVRSQLGPAGIGRLRWPVLCVVAAFASVTASTALPARVAAAPGDFRATAASEPWSPALGYVTDAQERTAGDLGLFLSTFLRPGEQIYDFSNQPGLYFYILDDTPSTRHFFAGTDYSAASQEETVADLSDHRPELVVLYGSGFGAQAVWDGISNAVRDYLISQYLLDHYRPFADVDGQLIYAADDAQLSIPGWLRSRLGSRLTLTDLPFRYPDCAWGYAPEFLDQQPPPGEPGTVIGGTGVPSASWTLSGPPSQGWAAYHWIQLSVAATSGPATFVLDDTEVSGENHDVTFRTLPGGPSTYRFPVGACPQWLGYSSATLQLRSSVPVTITQVELLP